VTTLAADYSFVHPEPTAFKVAGYDVVLRYLSHDSGKNLTHPEAKALRHAGLSIGLVWETVADRALAGNPAGDQDRVEAEAMAAQLGYPKTCVIFYAVDTDVSPDAVEEYFADVAQGATHPVGVYGSLRVCEGMRDSGHVTYLWQTEAWSGTDVSKHAHIYQRVRATRNLPKGCDEDVLLKPLPLWAPHSDQPVDSNGPTDDKAKPIGEMTRTVAQDVLKALQGRTAPVAKADRALLVDLRAAINAALRLGADAVHNGETAMVR
jgi:uncharacterized protein with von Willebrand factor type A (vWA) domain